MNWNKGCYEDGYAARMVYQVELGAAPKADIVGDFARESWVAGYQAAENELLEGRLNTGCDFPS